MKKKDYMNFAISLARKAYGLTSPNPLVGAVIVKGREIVGKGYHRKAGLPHAEVIALNEAREKATGSVLYVNLEPCAHFGRTPPCVNAIIKAGIKKVVVSMLDPNPLVKGKGVEILRNAGIEVEVGLLEEEARRLNESYVVYMEKKRPFFILKGALSFDGKIATRTLESKWISNELSREYTNRIRSTVDAIMVGINTVISDNPILIPRIPRPKKYPVRIVLDSKLRIPLSSELVKTASKYKTIIFCAENSNKDKEQRLREMGVEIIEVESDDNGKVSVKRMAEVLYIKEVQSILVEGGSEVNWSLLKEGLVDKILFFFAPILIGGKNALSFIGGRGVDFLTEAKRLKISKIRRLKEDIFVEAYVRE